MPENDTIEYHADFSEAMRKVVHIGLGFIAFALGWLTWPLAAAVAFAALLTNWLILPRLGGKKISRDERGTDMGIILYPFSVLCLILIFRNRLDIAAVGWIALALGDGMATIIGRNLGGPRIPWNPAKSILGSLGFFEAAVPVAWLATLHLSSAATLLPTWMIVVAAITVAMIVESLPTGIDDNLTVPASAAFTMWALSSVTTLPSLGVTPGVAIWLLVNVALALLGYLAGTVNRSGLVGGALLGSVLILFGGWQLYAVLLAFFVIGSGVTKAGIRKKSNLGIAQEEGGRRGFSHAFANVGVAAILALMATTGGYDASALWLGAVAALATATADTTASEMGQLIGKRPFLPLTFRRVPVGTEGAISVEGTLSGAIAASVVALIGAVLLVSHSMPGVRLGTAIRVAFSGDRLPGMLLVAGLLALAAVLGSWLESVAGSWNRSRPQPISNGTLNFLNTAVGALLMIVFLRVG